ncbi:MAG TPA: phosphatidylserine decarboxylase [Candidatus Dadabacteria bacterium]|nr:phosphatidylserine decarboxylase [Candidatus Dadabacteria bacterium]
MKIDYKWSVAREGYFPILTSFFVCWLGTAFFGLSFISIILFGLFLVVLYFFRDPERIVPNVDGMVSPADGKIISIDKSTESEFVKKEMKRICIFLSLLDCHINRSPIDCSVNETRYYPGAFHFANSDKSVENERLCIHLKSDSNEDVIVIQYAGFLARRIVSYISVNSNLKRGQRIGIIKFGSRVDIYVPENYHTNLKAGDSVVAGETILYEREGK